MFWRRARRQAGQIDALVLFNLHQAQQITALTATNQRQAAQIEELTLGNWPRHGLSWSNFSQRLQVQGLSDDGLFPGFPPRRRRRRKLPRTESGVLRSTFPQ